MTWRLRNAGQVKGYRASPPAPPSPPSLPNTSSNSDTSSKQSSSSTASSIQSTRRITSEVLAAEGYPRALTCSSSRCPNSSASQSTHKALGVPVVPKLSGDTISSLKPRCVENKEPPGPESHDSARSAVRKHHEKVHYPLCAARTDYYLDTSVTFPRQPFQMPKFARPNDCASSSLLGFCLDHKSSPSPLKIAYP